MSDRDYIHGNDADDDDLRAFDEGKLVEWRRGPDGCMWYKRAATPGEIQAVPGDELRTTLRHDGLLRFGSDSPVEFRVPHPTDNATKEGGTIEAEWQADDVELADDGDDFDKPTLDDFERAQLQQWAEEMRSRGREGDEDAHPE